MALSLNGHSFMDPLDSPARTIEDAVFQVMADTDIDKIRVTDVIKIAGVSRSTFYRYYSDVRDVVETFEDGLLDNMRAINDIALKGRYQTVELEPTPFMVARMEVLKERRDKIVVLNGEHGDPTFTHKATVFMHDYFSKRMRNFFESDVDFELYLAFVLAGHHNLVQFWLEKMPEVEPRHVAAMLNKLNNSALFISEQGLRRQPHFKIDNEA
jgi:AcrR family transcriptional regulator